MGETVAHAERSETVAHADRSRVLVVDDDAAVRTLLREALRDEGYDVRTTGDGVEALGVMSRWRPDVIVLDLRLPLLQGEDVARETRRRRLAPDAATLVISAEHGAPRVADELGAAFLGKPFDLAELLEKVEHLASESE